ncbi:polymorphic toxin-type HINT domain-containing protein [Ruminococcus sp.]|uniref:polymorphic toxin-type HINT domain-containing protein n=1 Tax=Ruminococcus sp. TaxID=41978 RepID=UPI003450F97B
MHMSCRWGDILTDSKATSIEFIKNETTDSPVTVYNFQVEDYHTYYVGECNVFVHNANNYSDIPKTGKPGSPSWKKAIKDLKEAKGKGNNFVAESKADAEALIKEAFPDLKETPKYSGKGLPKAKDYQFLPIDNEYGIPHIKFRDWSKGKKVLMDTSFERNNSGD